MYLTVDSNGICERFHRTIKNEFYQIAFRKKIYRDLEELQNDLDQWLIIYNQERTHTGKYCYGRTPYQTFQETKHLADEKMVEGLFVGALHESELAAKPVVS